MSKFASYTHKRKFMFCYITMLVSQLYLTIKSLLRTNSELGNYLHTCSLLRFHSSFPFYRFSASYKPGLRITATILDTFQTLQQALLPVPASIFVTLSTLDVGKQWRPLTYRRPTMVGHTPPVPGTPGTPGSIHHSFHRH